MKGRVVAFLTSICAMGNQCIGWGSREMDRDVWRWGIQD